MMAARLLGGGILLLLGVLLLLGGAGLVLLGLLLLGDKLDLGQIRLGLVDGLDQDALVLETITLSGHVELVVELLVDLLGLTVLAEQATEHALAAHPEDLGRHTGLLGTAALTHTHVATLATLGHLGVAAEARMDRDRLADDQTLLEVLANHLARVGHGDLLGLVGVEPDAALTASLDGRRKALLELEGRHVGLD